MPPLATPGQPAPIINDPNAAGANNQPQPIASADAQSLETKITESVAEASAIMAHFAPGVANAMAAGAECEPIVKGLVQMFIALFHHSVKTKTAGQ